jgi:hypothetical protein
MWHFQPNMPKGRKKQKAIISTALRYDTDVETTFQGILNNYNYIKSSNGKGEQCAKPDG